MFSVVLPLIVTCMVIGQSHAHQSSYRDLAVPGPVIGTDPTAVQRLKEMSQRGGSLAKWCICWYIGTTFVALVPTILLASLLWAKLYPVASEENLVVASADQATIAEREKLAIWQVVVNLGDSFVTNNSMSASMRCMDSTEPSANKAMVTGERLTLSRQLACPERPPGRHDRIDHHWIPHKGYVVHMGASCFDFLTTRRLTDV